jgi:hypothetical protein
MQISGKQVLPLFSWNRAVLGVGFIFLNGDIMFSQLVLFVLEDDTNVLLSGCTLS